jgi:hypothetical protein
MSSEVDDSLISSASGYFLDSSGLLILRPLKRNPVSLNSNNPNAFQWQTSRFVIL